MLSGECVCELTRPGARSRRRPSITLASVAAVLPPGGFAASVIHHAAVWIAPRDAATCEVYCWASFQPSLAKLWRDATKGS